MAKYIEGITGPFLGKVGPVVGSSRNGTPYMKSRGNARSSAATGSELENRNKFSAAHAWLKPLLPLLRVEFNGYSKSAYGYNAAKSYVLKRAMINGLVLPELVKISSGDLVNAPALNVILTADRKLKFNWSPDYIPGTDGKDQLMALAYHPASVTLMYVVHGAFRDVAEQIMELPPEFEGKSIHVYAAFIAADRSRQSDSTYFGPITVG